MGRRSPDSKKDKRKQQKCRKKLKFSCQHKHGIESDNCDTIAQDDRAQETEDLATDVNLDDAIGEDVVAVEMRLEDMMCEPTSQYSPEYLYKCRKRL